jgi:rsbT co-antagonist protein RsbR
MVENMTMELLTQMLERLPGVTFCSRMNPATMESRWLYINERAAELYEVPFAEIQKNPLVLLERVVPEDRARVEQGMARSITECVPMEMSSRLQRRDGTIRWVETHANVMRDADGAILWYGHIVDVTGRKQLEQSLADSESARSKAEVLYRTVIDALPVGVMVANQAREFVVFNREAERQTGGMVKAQDGDVTGAYGVFMEDGVTPLPAEGSGLARGLRGEHVEEEVVLRNPRLVADMRMRVQFTPLVDETGAVYATLGTTQDVTLQRGLEADLRGRHEELARSEEAKTALIERLRYAVDELSNPILEVWEDVLVMPIIGVVDSRRIGDMVQRLLAEVTRTQASFVIVDVTGVEVVDTQTADHLIKLMRKVEIVGARCVLSGIRPAVSETLVDIGVDFGRVLTLRNLKHALREALRYKRGEREARFELDDDEREEEQPRARARRGR